MKAWKLKVTYSVKYPKRVLSKTSFSDVVCTLQQGTIKEHLNKKLNPTEAQLNAQQRQHSFILDIHQLDDKNTLQICIGYFYVLRNKFLTQLSRNST